jgi:hypothetical protein
MQDNHTKFSKEESQLRQSIAEFHEVVATFHTDVARLVEALDELKGKLSGNDYRTLETFITPYRYLVDNPFKQGPIRHKNTHQITISSSLEAIFKTFEKQEVDQLWPRYREVISNYAGLAAFIIELRKKQPKLVEEIEKKFPSSGGGQSTFTSQIIKVVQTPPRYKLFVDGFIKERPLLQVAYPSLQAHVKSQGYKKLIRELDTLNKFTGFAEKLNKFENKASRKKMARSKQQKNLEAHSWLADRGQLMFKFIAGAIDPIATYKTNMRLSTKSRIKSKRQLKKEAAFSSLLEQQEKIILGWRNIANIGPLERGRIIDSLNKIIAEIKNKSVDRKNRASKKVLVASLTAHLEMIKLIDKKLQAEEKTRLHKHASMNITKTHLSQQRFPTATPEAKSIRVPPRPVIKPSLNLPSKPHSIKTAPFLREDSRGKLTTNKSRPQHHAFFAPLQQPNKLVKQPVLSPTPRTDPHQLQSKNPSFNVFEEITRAKRQQSMRHKEASIRGTNHKHHHHKKYFR